MQLSKSQSSNASISEVTLVTDRTTLGGNDTVDWSVLGPLDTPIGPGTLANILPNNFSVTSENGLGLNVDIPPAAASEITPPFVFQSLADGIETNFGNEDFVLLTGLRPGPPPALGNPGPLTITFDRPVFGVGSQVAVDDIPGFTAFVSAFDNNDTLIGNFSLPGTSSLELDDSAIFLGVKSDIPNISKLVFSSSETESAIGINDLSILSVNFVALTGENLGESGEYFGTDGQDEISLVSTVPASIFGKRQNDRIIGNEANDIISGGKGFDVLIGNGGDDVLSGDRGIDLLIGGTGNDTFVLAGGTVESNLVINSDVILGYVAGEDRIIVEGLSAENIQITPITTEEFEQLVTGVLFQGGVKIEAIATGEVLGFVENNLNLTVDQLSF